MQAWIFDVDGVLVHLQERKLTEIKLVEKLLKILQNGDLLIFVSGRSPWWQYEHIISVVKNYAQELGLPFDIFQRVYISGEFGGVSLTFENGEPKEKIEKDFVIPSSLRKDLEHATTPFLDSFVIEPKETLFSTFVKNVSTFEESKQKVVDTYQKTLDRHHAADIIEILVDTSAINIKKKKATKLFATSQILSWIQSQGFNISQYFAFGDSPSDLEIANELYRQGKNFTFIFVGDPSVLPANLPFSITITKAKYDKGTLSYLESIT